MSKLYCDIDGITNPLNISISNAHGNATAMATIQCVNTTLDIGDPIVIDLGFTDDHGEVFNGHIKTKSRNIPEDSFTFTAQDKLVQAVDYFIVGPGPDEPYNFGKGIAAEDLVGEVLELAGLAIDHHDNTNFTFGVNNDVEVNLVSSYDYAKMIADIVTWSLWCDKAGEIYFQNRKPYIMTGDSGQIGDTTDERLATPITTLDDYTILNAFHSRDEKELRNRVVVYGEGSIKADESRETSWDQSVPPSGGWIQVLPDDFYKSVIASYAFIGTQEIADRTAEYNLRLLNRITNKVSVSCIGNHIIEPRKIIALNEPYTGVTGNWYIFGANLNWSNAGFTAELDLRI